jgi:protein ImuB
MGRCALNTTECYACVCVKEFSAQALLRLRPELRDRACVVMEGEPPLQLLCSLTRQARSLGLARAMTLVEVETFPHITVLVRSPDEEAAARAALMEFAGGFSPRVEECSEDGMFLCAIDIAGTEKLFGPAETMAHNLLARIRTLGIAASIAISRNFHTAAAIAKGLTARKPVQVIPAGEEKEALASLPLSVLSMTEEQAETFSLWGIRSLGMLADLPEKELIARMGQAGKQLQELARGERPHLFQPVVPEFTLVERMELDSPVEVLDALLFAVNLMLEQLIVRASARALALASVTITLVLEKGATHARTVRPALPTNDRLLWLKLIHLDLDAHPPQAAIVAVTIEAEAGRISKVQLGLFSPQLPESSRLDVTLARIRAIVGEENVGRAVLKDTHAAEGFRMEPFHVPSGQVKDLSSKSVRLALRRIRPAEAVFVALHAERPNAFAFRSQRYLVERAYGPWLTSGDWWNAALWGLEQWDLVARAQSGTMLCCCLERNVLQGQWRMVALYD